MSVIDALTSFHSIISRCHNQITIHFGILTNPNHINFIITYLQKISQLNFAGEVTNDVPSADHDFQSIVLPRPSRRRQVFEQLITTKEREKKQGGDTGKYVRLTRQSTVY